MKLAELPLQIQSWVLAKATEFASLPQNDATFQALQDLGREAERLFPERRGLRTMVEDEMCLIQMRRMIRAREHGSEDPKQ
jgi:hypothetical protein